MPANGQCSAPVRLRLSKAQWQALEREADDQGKSFRQFLKMRLLKALPELEKV